MVLLAVAAWVSLFWDRSDAGAKGEGLDGGTLTCHAMKHESQVARAESNHTPNVDPKSQGGLHRRLSRKPPRSQVSPGR
jgi:hypothetical protein